MVMKKFLIGLKHFLIYIDGYIDFYNNERIQEKTKWMAPVKIQESIRDINYLILCPVFGVLISKSKMIYCFFVAKN